MSGADALATDLAAAHDCLVSALAAAQGEIGLAAYDRAATITGSTVRRYATLAAVMAAVRAPLARHGLALTHAIRAEDGAVVVETALLWRAERLATEVVIPLAQASAQQVGSAITYGRRYGVMALLAVASAEDDDDGEDAQQAAPAPARPEWGRGNSRAADLATAAVRPQDRRVPPEDAPPPLPHREPEPRTEAPRLAPHQAEVWTRWTALGRTRRDLVDLLGREGVEGLSDLTPEAARRVLDTLPPAPTEAAPKAGVRRGGAR